jgi:DHA1 family tetracycline resistance protein-like MFS transporter
MAAAAAGAEGRGRTGVLFVAVFLDSASFNLLTAVVPSMLLGLEGGDLQSTSNALAQMSALSAAVEFVLNPMFGGLSDWLGRRSFLLLSPAANVLLRGLVAWRPTRVGVVLGHVLCAALGGRYGGNAFMNAGAYPMVNDIYSTPHDRADYFARLTSVAGIGAMLGPVIGAGLARRGERLPFTVAVAMGALNLVLVGTTMKESLLPECVKPFRFTGSNPLSFLALFNPWHRYNTKTNGAVRRLAAVLALQSCGSGLEEVREVYARQELGWTALENGLCRSIEGVENICCGGLCGYMLARLGPWLNTRVGNIMNACAIFGMGLSRSTPLLYITQAPGAALVCAAATKSALACYADQVGIGQGEYLSHQSSMMAVLKILTPLVYGASFRACSGTALTNAPFLISATVFVLADVLMVITVKEHELLVVPESALLSDEDHDDSAENSDEQNKAIQLLRPKQRDIWAKALVLGSILIAASTQVIPKRGRPLVGRN